MSFKGVIKKRMLTFKTKSLGTAHRTLHQLNRFIFCQMLEHNILLFFQFFLQMLFGNFQQLQIFGFYVLMIQKIQQNLLDRQLEIILQAFILVLSGGQSLRNYLIMFWKSLPRYYLIKRIFIFAILICAYHIIIFAANNSDRFWPHSYF